MECSVKTPSEWHETRFQGWMLSAMLNSDSTSCLPASCLWPFLGPSSSTKIPLARVTAWNFTALCRLCPENAVSGLPSVYKTQVRFHQRTASNVVEGHLSYVQPSYVKQWRGVQGGTNLQCGGIDLRKKLKIFWPHPTVSVDIV